MSNAGMDLLISEFLMLLQDMHHAQMRQLEIATARQEAIRRFDVASLDLLLERERHAIQELTALEERRKVLANRFRHQMGLTGEPNTSAIAARCPAPQREAILALATQVRNCVEQVSRLTRINQKASSVLLSSLSRVIKAVTGVAQQAGLYSSKGRRMLLLSAAQRHLLDAVA